MTTGVKTADWVKRIADDERRRDAVLTGEREAATRKADLVRLHGRQLLDDLRAAVARDIEAFRDEFAGDPARDIVLDDADGAEGFVVRKPPSPAVTLSVAAHLDEPAGLACHYQFTSTNGLPPRESRLELVFAPDDADTLRLATQHAGRVFASADALSEHLLGPVFTGRPR